MPPKQSRDGAPKTAVKMPPAVKNVMFFLVFVEVTSGFVQGFYAPLLPEMAAHLGVSGEAMNWFQTSQAMAAAVSVPLMARLGDIYGHRKLLRAAIVAVLIGTVTIALAPSYPVVLIARVFVGPLGVWLPLAIALIYAQVSGASASRAISILSASLMGGIVLGTVAAGAAEDLVPSLPLVLLIPAVMTLISAYAVFFKIPESADLTPAKIDWLGFGGLAVIMVSLIAALAFVGPTHAKLSLLLFATTAAALLVWVWWEKRAAAPAIDLRLVTSPSLGPLYITGFLLGVVIIDAPANLSDFLSRDPDVFGYGFNASTNTVAGLIAGMLAFATLGGFSSSFIAAKIGFRKTLVVSSLAAAAGQALLVGFSGSLPIFWVSGLVTGFGMGVLVGSLPALVAEAAPKDRTGIATGLYNALLAMGGAVGGAVFKQVLVAFRDADRHATLPGYLTVWALCVGVFLLAAFLMARVHLPAGRDKGH